MMGKSRQLHVGRGTVGALGQHNAQYFGGFHCVVAVCLIEIAHAEQQHRVRVFRLERVILFHQRGVSCFVCHR